MAKAMQGIERIFLMREIEKESSENASKLFFQTEYENKIKVDSDSEATKDGPITKIGDPEYDISVTCFVSREDPWAQKSYKATVENWRLGLWEIDRGATPVEENKYPAIYYEGYINEYQIKAEADDLVELELSFAIDGIGQEGNATLTDEQAAKVQYAFKDTTPISVA